jgi:transposase
MQLAHNVWNKDKGFAQAQVIHFFGRSDQLDVEALKRLIKSMSRFMKPEDAIQKDVFWSTANVLNLTVDLIFFDTTNTYFEIEEPGPSQLKAYGKSKDKRDDLPQVTIGLAVPREGIPVRCWVLPGNQHDSQCVDQVQKDRKTKSQCKLLLHRSMGRYVKELGPPPN